MVDEWDTEVESSLVCQPYEPYAGSEGNCQSITPSSAKSMEASLAGCAKLPRNTRESTMAPGAIVTLGLMSVFIPPRSKTELLVVVDTTWFPVAISDAVVCVKLPVTVAEEIGRAEYAESPVITRVEPPVFSQVPFASLVRLEGIFQPLDSPKYLVEPTDNSLISGV